MSRKQIAGGCDSGFSMPASVSACSKPPMMFAAHDCACWACQMASTAASPTSPSSSVSSDDDTLARSRLDLANVWSSEETELLGEVGDAAVLAIWHAQQAQSWAANIIGGFEQALTDA